MDLFEGEEGEIGCACGSLEAAAVFEDVFAGVPVGEAEVEDSFVVQGADASRASAERMD